MTIQMVWQSKIDKDVSSKQDIALPNVTWISFLFVPFSEFLSRFAQPSTIENMNFCQFRPPAGSTKPYEGFSSSSSKYNTNHFLFTIFSQIFSSFDRISKMWILVDLSLFTENFSEIVRLSKMSIFIISGLWWLYKAIGALFAFFPQCEVNKLLLLTISEFFSSFGGFWRRSILVLFIPTNDSNSPHNDSLNLLPHTKIITPYA